MKIGIMQPYLFPYIGYFQLMSIVDIFVLHDDVQYIKGGWINRNRVLLDGKPYLFTFSVEKSSFFENINRRIFSDSLTNDKLKLLRFLHSNYRKAPYYEPTMSLIEFILNGEDRKVSRFIRRSLEILSTYLGLTCDIVNSSELLGKNNELKAQERVLDMVKSLGGDHYINPIGGTALYDNKTFLDQNIKLNFIQTDFTRSTYKQFDKPFVPGLSIIDVLMFNSREQIKQLLSFYNLL